MSRIPLVSGQSLLAFDFLHGPAYEAVFVPGGEEQQNDTVREFVDSGYLPRVLWLEATDALKSCESLAALFEGRESVNAQPTLYLCERGRCELPVAGEEAIKNRLEEL